MKKFLSVILAVLLVTTLCFSAGAENSAEDSAMSFPENAEPAMDVPLKEYAEEHNLNLTEEPLTEEKVLQEPYTPTPPNPDSRTTFENDLYTIPGSHRSEYPHRAIAKMDIHYRCGCSASGTGFMISTHGLMTAAHCLVCSEHRKTADSLTFYFGFKNYRDYYYKYEGCSQYWYGTDFPNGYEFEWDYGYVKFDDRIGDRTGWFGVLVQPDSQMETTPVTLEGFVGYDLLSDYGRVKVWDSNLVNYTELDSKGGLSGSPLYTWNNYAVAINVGENSSANFARRITDAVFQFMQNDGLF